MSRPFTRLIGKRLLSSATPFVHSSRRPPSSRGAASQLMAVFLFAALLFVVARSATVCLAADPRAQALTYMEQGSNAYRMGDLAEATRQWTDAIRLCRLAE